ncbi:tryptophan--tRNA ligase, mitochondrial [Macrosteles quadrilineatus]|uniref:tryptophan--tRNA ligase, mitochondrial n=1 Tax=Macrosteles quadrilineatus TaxID=74068 RepID=UPI0023E32195|nr:tryptophan--tRNA ligase, mitochondrial [Macrosteles quadrilineatus]
MFTINKFYSTINVYRRVFSSKSTKKVVQISNNKTPKAPKPKKIKWEKRIFSGIQPTGVLHLGNYFGAIEKWVELQNEGNDVLYSIVDLHSITVHQDPEELRSKILLMAASLIACGIDPAKSVLFQQSKVHQHVELAWVLFCNSTMGRLSHLPQFKEKTASMKEIPLGIYLYPVLMAADVMLYRATHVPVGEDQLPHMNLAVDLAQVFNNRYGETFPVPEIIIEDSARNRVRSLREPLKKMSKSHTDPKSRIELTDTPDQIVGKVKKAVTDFTSAVSYDPVNRPGVSNLVALHALSAGKTFQQVCDENAHIQTGQYKRVVADAIVEKFNPIREEMNRLLAAPEYLEEVLDQGAQRATMLAEITWMDVKQKIGLQTLPLPRHISASSVL